MKEPKTISITLQERIYPSDEDVGFSRLLSKKLKRILYSKLYDQFRASKLNELKRAFLKKYDITSTYYNCIKNESDGMFKFLLKLQQH